MISIVSITFLSMLVLQSLHLLYQNKAKGADLCRAYIARTDDVIRIRLKLSRPIKVKPGQHVVLWIPAAGFCSFLQSHPFTVVSWSEGKRQHLDLLVQPRKGLTRKLLQLAKTDSEQRLDAKPNEYIHTHYLQPHLAMISGLHGLSVPVDNYKTVLMIASGFGIASHLPYLRQLYHSCKTRNRRIHLVWEPEAKGTSPPDSC
jgi:NAD(P)H-flavin reductase